MYKKERNCNLIFTVLCCIIGGLGAGVGTGLAGLSAAAFISPVLIGALRIPAYEATAIGLASDVFASAISAITYYRHGNLDLRRALKMLVIVFVGTIVGSIIANKVSDNGLGYLSILGSVLLGLNLVIHPVNQSLNSKLPQFFGKNSNRIYYIICSLVIGFICGFMGTGGGMMMLFVLTVIMGFRLKRAVGTSVFIMTFTALLGSSLHFAIRGFSHWGILVICAAVTFVSAWVTAKVANGLRPATSGRITGVLLLITAVIMLASHHFGVA